jgi:hypothetical protein
MFVLGWILRDNAPSTNTATKCGVLYGKVPYPVFFVLAKFRYFWFEK